MKIVIIVFLASTMFVFDEAFSQIKTDKNEQLKKEKTLDTLLVQTKELSLSKKFYNSYQKDKKMVTLIAPYFVKDIVSPFDKKNDIYKTHIKLGKAGLGAVKAAILKYSKENDIWRKRLSGYDENLSEQNKYSIVQLPVYYLTPNVVLFNDGENIAKYYNLETGRIKYAIIKNGALISLVGYSQGGVTFFRPNKSDSISFAEVLKMNKAPIAFKSISSNPNNVGGTIDWYGYLMKDRIVFSMYYEEEFTKGNANNKTTTYTKRRTMEVAESFFASEKSYPIIKQWLNAYYKNIMQKK